MKKIITIAILVLTVYTGYAQNEGKVVVGSGNTSCTCQEGYTICQASSLFMSCCTCCQPGNSCGAWSAFGLCGCGCNKVTQGSSKGEVRFYKEKYVIFLRSLQELGYNTTALSNYAESITLNRLAKTLDVAGVKLVYYSYKDAEIDSLSGFSDYHIKIMKELSVLEKYASFIKNSF